ncbi:MAG: DUF1972 domain-containing protein [Bacteroidota bacterium]|nr:DUF1972 domain-containing protein [Bacteroidota bacterium]
MSIRIGIIGSRGIPNHYGGFERLAEQLSRGLVNKGHEVCVYNSHNHPYVENTWRGVNIIHCYDPEHLIGCSGQFIYDLNCMLDARSRKFDIILILGYTSSSIWTRLLPRSSTIIYHMDGLEWQRSKYSHNTRKFLLYAEKLAVRLSDFHISDSPPIQSYYLDKYNLSTEYIAYGSELFTEVNEEVLKNYELTPDSYLMLIARIEPENNIEMILQGFSLSNTEQQLLVVGNIENNFGKYLTKKFGCDKRIRFTGSLYDDKITHTLRHYSHLYFHGHSSGGTNPSLLEAMASSCLIAAHDNVFNRTVLEKEAFYFSSAQDIKQLIEHKCHPETRTRMVSVNLKKITTKYNWEEIIDHYERYMLQCRYIHSNERNLLSKEYSCE